MIVSVVRDLANRYSKSELDSAIEALETKRENTLGVAGKDDGERLSNLLAAAQIRSRMDKGMSLNDALREHSQRVRSMISMNKKTSG